MIQAPVELQSLIERVGDGFIEDDFGEPTTDNIYELLAETSNENKCKFNIETLSRHLYGIGGGDFMLVAARPETGKSAFVISLVQPQEVSVSKDIKSSISGTKKNYTDKAKSYPSL